MFALKAFTCILSLTETIMASSEEGCISWLCSNFLLARKDLRRNLFSKYLRREGKELSHTPFDDLILTRCWVHLYPTLAKNVPLSNGSAIGVVESCRQTVIMWIRPCLSARISWDFLWLQAIRCWAKVQLCILTAEPEKQKYFALP